MFETALADRCLQLLPFLFDHPVFIFESGVEFVVGSARGLFSEECEVVQEEGQQPRELG